MIQKYCGVCKKQIEENSPWWFVHDECKKKAEKWDEHVTFDNPTTRHDDLYHINQGDYNKMAEKAQILDEMTRENPDIKKMDEIVEKAKILDEFTKICGYQKMDLDALKVIKSLADQQSEDITARMSTHPYVSIPTSEYNRLHEIARKWNMVKHAQVGSGGRTLETELAVNPPITPEDDVRDTFTKIDNYVGGHSWEHSFLEKRIKRIERYLLMSHHDDFKLMPDDG